MTVFSLLSFLPFLSVLLCSRSTKWQAPPHSFYLSRLNPRERNRERERGRQMQRDRWRATEMATDRVEHSAVKWSSTETWFECVGTSSVCWKQIWSRFLFLFGGKKRNAPSGEGLIIVPRTLVEHIGRPERGSQSVMKVRETLTLSHTPLSPINAGI